MQDYHVYAHYQKEKSVPPTSPQYSKTESKTVAVKGIEKEKISNKLGLTPARAAGLALAVGAKINQYVGELTENRITARRNQVGLTFAALGLLAFKSPISAAIGAVAYVANAEIQYSIKNYKANLTADYARQLSGGTVKRGR